MLDDRETFYLRTIEDLERRIEDSDPYEILLASGLIRKLLLDEDSLVDQVNKKYKVKLSFKVGISMFHPSTLRNSQFYSIQDSLDPDGLGANKPSKMLKREQFLKTTVLYSNNQEYSIKDIIRFEANISGGVHAGTPKNKKDEILKEINQIFSLGGYQASLRQLKAIGHVILKSLAPLTEKIRNQDKGKRFQSG